MTALTGYMEADRAADASDASTMQRVSSLVAIQRALQQKRATDVETKRNEQLRAEIEALPPEKRTRENVLPLLMKYGNVKEMVPLLKSAEKAYQPIGAGGLLDTGTGDVTPPAARPEAPPLPTTLSRLMAEKAKLPPGDSRHAIYDAAIRKESETAKQITPPPDQPRPPPGYRHTKNGDLEAIPGGPADTKIQGQFNADTSTLGQAESALDRLGQQVNLVKNSNLSGITGVLGALPNMPGGKSADAQARLDSLKYQIGFNVLQEMKNASKTNASGLGQVTEKEHIYLQNQLGSLEKAQSEAEIRRVLDDIAKFAEESKGRIRNAYNLKHKDRVGGSQTGGASGGAPASTVPAGAPAGGGGWSIRPSGG